MFGSLKPVMYRARCLAVNVLLFGETFLEPPPTYQLLMLNA